MKLPRNLIPPPIYALGLAFLMWQAHKAEWGDGLIVAPLHYIGVALIGIGLAIDLYSLYLFLKAKTTPNPIQVHKAETLVTTGLYRITRNPMYVGLALQLAGLGVYFASLWFVVFAAMFVMIITHMQIKPEEAFLEVHFGQAYIDYKQRVPRWLGF